MKNLVPWIKSNLVTVIALLVAVVALPVAWYFANGMRAGIAEDATQKTTVAERSIREASMSYEIPAIDPGAEPWSGTAAPNRMQIERVAAQRERVRAAGVAVFERLVEKNSGGKSPLVERLFPAPAGGESGSDGRVRLTAEMMDVWGSLSEELIASAGAGQAPDADQVLASLELIRNQRVRELTATRSDETLTPEEEAALQQELSAERRRLYTEHAAGLSFYADAEGLFGSRDMFDPNATPGRDTFLRVLWGWQHTAWVEQDLVSGLAAANAGPGGPISGPVKRVLAIDVEPWEAVSVAAGTLTEPIARDFSVSHTGRAGGNALYDVRYATVDLIADAGRLDEIVNAFAATNFITVIDTDIEHLGKEPDLSEGYVYGPNPVARVVLRLETIWIRDWYQAWIPAPVREAKGLPELINEGASENAADNDFDR